MSPAQHVLTYGGNGFLGLEFVEAALPSYEVTVVHRGNEYWDSAAILSNSRVRQLICDRSALTPTCMDSLRGTPATCPVPIDMTHSHRSE